MRKYGTFARRSVALHAVLNVVWCPTAFSRGNKDGLFPASCIWSRSARSAKSTCSDSPKACAEECVDYRALVGGDTRVREAHRESVRVALTELEPYVQARLGGNRRPETTGNAVTAVFEHDSARPVSGYAAPQLHTHAVIFNLTETADGTVRPLQPRELYRTQQCATAVYRSELAARLTALGYEIERGRSGQRDPRLHARVPRRVQPTSSAD
jgi:hypothetical protein